MHRVIDEMCGESMIECSPSATGSDDEVMLQVKLPKWLKIQKPWGGKRDSLDTSLDTPLGGVEVKSTKSTKKRTPIVPKGDINHPFIKIWNELAKGSFPLVEVLSKSRAAALARCASISSVDDWTKVVQWAIRDEWLTGRKTGSDGKPFTGCTIDTIMRESKFVGYLERAKQGNTQQPKSIKLEDL
jgi:hypothetical protein